MRRLLGALPAATGGTSVKTKFHFHQTARLTTLRRRGEYTLSTERLRTDPVLYIWWTVSCFSYVQHNPRGIDWSTSAVDEQNRKKQPKWTRLLKTTWIKWNTNPGMFLTKATLQHDLKIKKVDFAGCLNCLCLFGLLGFISVCVSVTSVHVGDWAALYHLWKLRTWPFVSIPKMSSVRIKLCRPINCSKRQYFISAAGPHRVCVERFSPWPNVTGDPCVMAIDKD